MMNQSLRIYTLGRLTIELDGIVLDEFVSQKVPALFVYLLYHPREHQRDVLAEMFWCDTSSKQALKNLRTVLSNLQKFLGKYLEVTRQSLTIAEIDDIWVDTKAFELILESVKQKQNRPYSPRRLMTELETAIELYQGDFLVGLKTNKAPELDTWVTLERERLRGKARQALFQLAEIALENAAYSRGINAGRRLLTLDPFWEQALRLMMKLQAYSGNRTTAVKHYDSFVKFLQKELSIEAEEETQALYREIKTGRIQAVPPQPKPNNLQQATFTYIENPTVISQIHTRLDDPECRLLTIQGTGGLGKTSLVQHIAHKRLEDYRDGVFFVPLASLTAATFVIQAIMNALDIRYLDSRRAPQETLLEHIRERHLLLILDNFEHIMDAVPLIQTILQRTSYLQILVTSREQLQLQSEYIFTLDTLPYPANGQNPEKYEAVQLFTQTAQRVQNNFLLNEHNISVTEICRLVDGLPLAIMIAAAWVQFLQPEEIVTRIEENLEFLTISRRDLPERHRGIIALLNSTWAELIEHEKKILEKLSVFPSDFDTESASQIASAELDDLTILVSKSLLQAGENERFHLHELLRRYTREQVDDNTLLETRQVFLNYFRQWVIELQERGLPSHEQYAAIDREYHNLWIIDWLSEEETHRHILHLAPILVEYWLARAFPIENNILMLENALSFAEDDNQKAQGLIYLGKLLAADNRYDEAQKRLNEGWRLSKRANNLVLQLVAINEIENIFSTQGNFEEARDYLLQAIALAEQESQDKPRIMHLLTTAYNNLGIIYLQLKNLEEATHYSQLALEQKLLSNDLLGAALCYNNLGIIALDQDDATLAHQHFSEALRLAQEIEHTRFQTVFSGNLAEALHKQGELSKACQIYCETLQIAFRINNHKTILNVLEQLCDVALDLDEAGRAANLLGAAIRLREQINIAIQPRQKQEFANREYRIIKSIGSTAYEELIDSGHTMSLETVIQYAIQLSDIKI